MRTLPERSHAAESAPAPRQRRGRRRASPWGWSKRLALVALPLAAGFALFGMLVHTPLTPVHGHLVVAEFSNHTRDSLLGVAVTAAVRAELSKIAQVDLASARVAGPPHPPDPVQPGKVLVLVTGDVTALGPGFTVSARLVSADNGRLLAVVQEDAADAHFLLPTVKRLSQRLRGNVLQSLAPPAGTPSLKGRIAAWLVKSPEIDERAAAGAQR